MKLFKRILIGLILLALINIAITSTIQTKRKILPDSELVRLIPKNFIWRFEK